MEIAKYDADTLLALPTDKLDKSVFGSTYLPRIQLCGSSSDMVKEGKIGVGRFALITGSELTDLGPETHIAVFMWRPKAMDFGTMVTSHDVSSKTFIDIRSRSAVADSKCNYGPEFLCYHPQHGFCTFFCGSTTLRKEAPNISKALEMKFYNFTLKAKLCSNGTHKWHGLMATKCSFEVQHPTTEELMEALANFKDYPKEIPVTVERAV
jgi:hypothetical protein